VCLCSLHHKFSTLISPHGAPIDFAHYLSTYAQPYNTWHEVSEAFLPRKVDLAARYEALQKVDGYIQRKGVLCSMAMLFNNMGIEIEAIARMMEAS
jgi:hypothetical protein